MPYDVFVKAQIAADRMDGGNREKLLPSLGFLALGDRADERVDVTTRTFLALTDDPVAWALLIRSVRHRCFPTWGHGDVVEGGVEFSAELLLIADAAHQSGFHRGTASADHTKCPPLAEQFTQFKKLSFTSFSRPRIRMIRRFAEFKAVAGEAGSF